MIKEMVSSLLSVVGRRAGIACPNENPLPWAGEVGEPIREGRPPPPFCEKCGGRTGRATWLGDVLLTVARQRRTCTGFAVCAFPSGGSGTLFVMLCMAIVCHAGGRVNAKMSGGQKNPETPETPGKHRKNAASFASLLYIANRRDPNCQRGGFLLYNL